ncbi:hypothetical protein [Salinibacter sp.]|uniref:hypothetical protein n=1 Tax=Salinibacter sp. TaxID=2065818 RepID=UPI0021E8C161|nr:hypothetical protein [Salinibacter sp.]
MRSLSVLRLLILSIPLLIVGCGGSDSAPASSQTPPDSVRRDVEHSIASLNEMRE